MKCPHCGELQTAYSSTEYSCCNCGHRLQFKYDTDTQIFIKIPPSGKTVIIDLKLHNTILQIKEKISQKISSSTREVFLPEEIRLIYAGKSLEDQRTFLDYNITRDDDGIFAARYQGKRILS